jgi:uncharacterized cupredoxin-like copper-binding protein
VLHTALQLAPVVAAEPSKVPFYVAGALVVAWALFISMAIGMRRSSFPENDGQQRAVVAISVVLVAAAVVTAVTTAGTPAKEGEAKAAPAARQGTETASAPAAPSSAPSTASQPPATATAKSKPTATTGTPAPASSPAAKPTKLALATDPGGQLAYATKQLQAKAGTVSIALTNASPVEHDVAIAAGSKVLGQTPTFVGGSKTVTLQLTPGTYTFYCSVPGHRQAGMEGTLTVS